MSKRYDIEKITDIFQVPEEKFEDFLVDFRNYYTMGIHMTKLLETVADINGIKVEVAPQKLTWIDDDKHNVNIKLKTATEPDASHKTPSTTPILTGTTDPETKGDV